jgi:hypothetical protein
MHPNTFLANLVNHQKRDEVFVIMSFHDAFQRRWENVIEPCIREDLKLKANRVDYRESGESIVYDILDGIAHAKLVLSDITSVTMKDSNGVEWPQRNGNVMWEVGIAHTMRLPDEVIMIRSDSDPSIFDLTQFRAFPYDPLRVVQSRNFIRDLSLDRLRSIDQSKSRYVEQCVDVMDFPAWSLLTQILHTGSMEIPVIRNMGHVMGNMSRLPAINRLLDMGAIKTAFKKIDPTVIANTPADAPLESLMRYESTPLAEAMLKCAGMRMFSADTDQIAETGRFLEQLMAKEEAARSQSPG